MAKISTPRVSMQQPATLYGLLAAARADNQQLRKALRAWMGLAVAAMGIAIGLMSGVVAILWR